MRQVQVAIAIVSYKCAALTIDCLRSIEAERSSPGICIRVIVVDNDSGDAPMIDGAIAANSWSPWVTLLRAPKNGGFSYGNNLAFEHVNDEQRPDYFHLLNPDTLVRPGAIRALVRFLEEHPAIGIAGSGFENPDGSDWPIAFRFPSIISELESGLQFAPVSWLLKRWVVAMQMSSVAQPVDWVPGASMMIRPAVLDAIGGFDDTYFLYFEETDFCYRAKKAGFPTWYVPQSRVMHIAGQSTKVTERTTIPRRLPGYWFESRSRYFMKRYGPYRAIATDLVALAAYGIGSLKRLLQRRTNHATPHYFKDLAHHSRLWRRNRNFTTTRASEVYN